MKKLSDLLNCNYDIDILGITDDSRKVKSNYLFVATRGFNVDHFDYIESAIKNGAVAVVVDREIDLDIPYVIVENINEFYQNICAKYYDLDLDKFTFIGITGTDGKTTTATIVREMLNNIKNTAYIGTNGVEFCDKKMVSDNTTPCISELYSYLSEMKNNDCFDVVMEVSSEALLHNRVDGLKYKVVGFTNITEDHLNVHKTMENYVNSKKKLLDYLSDDGIAIINGDDQYCKSFECKNKVTYGFDKSNDCVISKVELKSNKTIFFLSYKGKTYKIISPFIGNYNVYNVTLAFLICLHFGLAPEYLVNAIYNLKPVYGRREILNFGQDFEIILDYAHTYNGIKNILSSVDNNKKTIVVTGCAGGREKSKRSLIGNYLLENANICIFTMDDPRGEDVDSIIDDMVQGSSKSYFRITDRKKAIYKAFELADKDTVVLILGKGRDNYMAIGDKKVYYCDYDVIENYFII